MIKLSIILLSLVSFAKEPTPSLRPSVAVPKMDDKTIDVEQYKNVKMPEKKKTTLTCRSGAGIEYGEGTANYDSCMREAEQARQSGKEQVVDPKHGTGFKIGN